MISKNSEHLIEWVYDYILDFTDENDTSGLTWESTPQEVRKFLNTIPRKEKVMKYGFYSGRLHYFLVVDFDDIKEGVKKGYLSVNVCRDICNLNRYAGHQNWSMFDVKALLYD